METESATRQYKYGYAKHIRVPAMRIALPVGISLALAVGLVRVTVINPDGQYEWVGGIILAAFLSVPSIGLAWVAVVDKRTLPGAVPDADNSVESSWYIRSARDAFHAILVCCGLGLFFISVALPDVAGEVRWTLLAVLLVSGIAFACSYLIRRYK
jgi:hypothetical protein